jgi:hypothetical protein
MAKKKPAPKEVQRDVLPIEEPAPELKIVEGTSPELTPEQQSAQAWIKGETPEADEPDEPKAKRRKKPLDEKIRDYTIANPTLSKEHLAQHFKTNLDVVVKALGLSKTQPDNGENDVAKKKKAAVKTGTNKKAGPTRPAKGPVVGVNKSKLIKEDLTKTPDAKPADLAVKHGVSEGLVQKVRREMGLTKKRKGGRPKGSTNKAKATRAAGNEVGNGHTGSQHGFISAAFALGLDKAQELLDRAKKLLG